MCAFEPFQVDHWERHSEHAEITSPFPQKLMITALGGSIATDSAGIVGQVVRFENLAGSKRCTNERPERKNCLC